MTREQIINDLTELVNDIPLELHLNSTRTAKLCDFLKSVIACIAKLTEENERLEKAKYIYATVDYCADDLAKALAENKRLAEENERLRVVADMSNTTLTDALRIVNEFCDNRIKRARADTVRNMHERLKGHFNICDKAKYPQTDIHNIIDRVAKKMLEGNGDE